jgi:fatty-acyl-CoA synthase
VRYDIAEEELVRDEHGFCIECQPGEVGHLLIRLKDNPTVIGDFRGYTDDQETRRKVVTDVFERGDRFFLSGDLLRYDDNDYFYFVDRVGDTYRWKGENVSTAEVAEVVARAPGVLGATVSSVQVPGHEGRAGLAALRCHGPFDAAGFWQAVQELPSYAQPSFVRILDHFDTTGTFKIQKGKLWAEGVDPAKVADPLYLRLEGGYVALTPELYARLLTEEVRL